MELHFKKAVRILASDFTVIWDETTDGGSFDWGNSLITIGVKSYHKDPLYTFGVLSHELLEVILVGLGARYQANGETDYLFSYNHKTFATAVQLHAAAISEFIPFAQVAKPTESAELSEGDSDNVSTNNT